MNETLVNILGKFSPLLGGMGRRSASAIFMFHRVIPEGEICYDPEMATSKELFEAFLDWADERYRVVSLVDLLSARPKQGTKRMGSSRFPPSLSTTVGKTFFSTLFLFSAPARCLRQFFFPSDSWERFDGSGRNAFGFFRESFGGGTRLSPSWTI